MPLLDRPALMDALRAAAPRTAAVIRAVRTPDRPVPGLAWTAGETATHLVHEFLDYTAYAQGRNNPPPGDRPARLNAAANAAQLRGDPDRDPDSLADRLLLAVDGFLAVEPAARPLTASNGVAMSWATMSSALLGELLVHGLDLARAGGRPWRISRDDALRVIAGVVTMIPDYVDRERAARLRAGFELRLRGGPRYLIEIDHGTARTGLATPAARPDCWISADPEAFLKVGFGRAGLGSQVLRGKLLAGGRKPWLAATFGGLVTGP
jgi:hypothetical protein